MLKQNSGLINVIGTGIGKFTIIDWYAEFNRRCTNYDNAARSGRSKSAVLPENITKSTK